MSNKPIQFGLVVPNRPPKEDVSQWRTMLLTTRYTDFSIGLIMLGQDYRNPALLTKMHANLRKT